VLVVVSAVVVVAGVELSSISVCLFPVRRPNTLELLAAMEGIPARGHLLTTHKSTPSFTTPLGLRPWKGHWQGLRLVGAAAVRTT